MKCPEQSNCCGLSYKSITSLESSSPAKVNRMDYSDLRIGLHGFFKHLEQVTLNLFFSPLCIQLLRQSNAAADYSESEYSFRIPNSSRLMSLDLVNCEACGSDIEANSLKNCSKYCTLSSNVVPYRMANCLHTPSRYILENALVLVEQSKRRYFQRCLARFNKFWRGEVPIPWLKSSFSILFCCRRHMITDLNSSSLGFSQLRCLHLLLFSSPLAWYPTPKYSINAAINLHKA